MSPVIFEYIRRQRHGKRFKVGVIMSSDFDGEIRVAWSKCNLDADVFDNLAANEIATKRLSGEEKSPEIPLCIKRQVRQMASRSIRYFQDAKSLKIM